VTETPVGNRAEAPQWGAPRGGPPDCQPPEQARRRGGIPKIPETTENTAASIAAMEPFYTRTEP